MWCSSAPDSLEVTITVSDTMITRRSREQGFKALGAWITFDGHFVKEIAELEVSAWRSFCAIRHLLYDNKVALRHRLPPVIMRRVIRVLVFWQLDTDTVTFLSPAGYTRQDAETNDFCTKTTH